MKQKVIRDRKYLIWLRSQPCILTGFRATEYEAVDPAHIGQAGMGMKSGDDEALPVKHSLHVKMHGGEISTLRELAPVWLLRAAFRAYAREFYAKYKLSDSRTERKEP